MPRDPEHATPKATTPAAETEAAHGQFELETFLPYRLSLLSNTVSEGIARAYRREFGLSVTEWRVIAILGRFPGLTASEITARGAMDKVAVSRAVNRLQERGLLERGAHLEDRRRQPLRLSSRRGRSLFRKVVPKALSYESRLLEGLDPEELELFQTLLTRLLDRAETLNREPG